MKVKEVTSRLHQEDMVEKLYLRVEGPGRARVPAQSTSIDDVRAEAVKYLGAFLFEHPHFADEGHWRLNVENEYGKVLLHVIVATVTARTARE